MHAGKAVEGRETEGTGGGEVSGALRMREDVEGKKHV